MQSYAVELCSFDEISHFHQGCNSLAVIESGIVVSFAAPLE